MNACNSESVGAAHLPVVLEPLVDELKKAADYANVKAKDRKAELETLLRHCKKSLAEHDNETEKLMEQIQTAKRKQVFLEKAQSCIAMLPCFDFFYA